MIKNPDMKSINPNITIDSSQVNAVDPILEGGATQQEINENNLVKFEDKVNKIENINDINSSILRNENGNILIRVNNNSLLEVKINGTIATINGSALITEEDAGIITKAFIDNKILKFIPENNINESINFNYFNDSQNNISSGNVLRINTAKLDVTPTKYLISEINSTNGTFKIFSDPEQTPFVGSEPADVATKQLVDNSIASFLMKLKEYNPNINLEFLKQNEKK